MRATGIEGWIAVGTLFALLFALGCGSAEEPSGTAPDLSVEDTARIEAELKTWMERYTAMINHGEWKSTLQFYSDDPRFYWAEPGRGAYDSKQAVERAIDAAAGMISEMNVSAGNPRYAVLSERHAVMVTDLSQRFAFSSGGTMEMDVVLTAVLQREETGWKFLIGQVAPAGDDED